MSTSKIINLYIPDDHAFCGLVDENEMLYTFVNMTDFEIKEMSCIPRNPLYYTRIGMTVFISKWAAANNIVPIYNKINNTQQ